MFERFFSGYGYFEVPGEHVPWAEFVADLERYLARSGRVLWSEDRIIAALGPGLPVGRGPANVKIVGNLSRRFRRPRMWVSDGKGNVRLEKADIRLLKS
jgi:hypothetical protein